MFQNEEYKFVRRKGTRLCQPESMRSLNQLLTIFRKSKITYGCLELVLQWNYFRQKFPYFIIAIRILKVVALRILKVVQGETELSFRLIPSLAKTTSSLTISVRGFVWDWVKEGMSLKDNTVSPCCYFLVILYTHNARGFENARRNLVYFSIIWHDHVSVVNRINSLNWKWGQYNK